MFKYWTAEETDLAMGYRKQGLLYREIADKMGKTKSSVAQRLQRLPDRIKIRYRNSRIWGDAEINLLKQEYNGKSPATKCKLLLIQLLGKKRSLYSIQHKAQEYRLQRQYVNLHSRSCKKWTGDEDALLIENRQKYSLTWLSENLKRSITSVNNRSAILDLKGEARDGWYTYIETAEGLGVSPAMLSNLIKDGKIKAIRRNGDSGNNSDWEIREENIYSFITRYPQFLQNRRPDMLFLVNILTKGDIKYKI
jgi:hypothetical protein